MPGQPPQLATRLPLLDEILDRHAAPLGADFAAYRNHAYRVTNFCGALAPGSIDEPAIGIAAAFHDLGIWTDATFDYLEPSQRHAREWLAAGAHRSLSGLVDAMIGHHHQVTAYRGAQGALVDLFRRADWLDVTRGLLPTVIPRAFLAEVFGAFPDAGFHRKLLRLTARQLVRNPLKPLPMLRW